MAPGYSHSRTLRFCTTRGFLPAGAGIVANSVLTSFANNGSRSASRVSVARDQAVLWPRSSSPFGERKRVPRRSSFPAVRFISATKSSVVADTPSASATAASFADWSRSASRSSRTVSFSPSRTPSTERPTRAAPSCAASALTVTTCEGDR